jgi:hypothetical protein
MTRAHLLSVAALFLTAAALRQANTQQSLTQRALSNTEGRAAERGIRIAQVGMVEGVEVLKAELDALLLVQGDPLEQREIGADQIGSASEGAGRVAEGISRVLSEGTGTQPSTANTGRLRCAHHLEAIS